MNRAFILITLLVSITLTAVSQGSEKVLTYEQINSGTELFSNKENWAEVIVQYRGDFDLEFKIPGIKILDHTNSPISIENLDKSSKKAKAVLARKSVNSDGTEYALWIRIPEDKKPTEMIITTTSPEILNKVNINLSELQPKERVRYRLYDPYDSAGGSVFQYHQVMGNEFFKDSNYAAARQEFVLASHCDASTVDKANVRNMIANCDSMTVYLQRVERYVNNEQWMDAIRCVRQAGKFNANDLYLINTYNYCNKKLLNDSNRLLAEAQDLYDQGKYADAKVLYDKVAQFKGPFSAIAEEGSKLCDVTYKMESNRERYFGLELGVGGLTSLGITKGKYTNGITTYITWRINGDIFNLLRQRFYIHEHARLDLTPLTIAFPVYRGSDDIFKGVWLNMGVGATAVNIYKPTDSFKEWLTDTGQEIPYDQLTQHYVDTYMREMGSNKSSDALSMDINVAATPEIGAVVKVWRVGIRLTYRHYISFSNAMKDVLGKNQFSIGIGYCY